MQTTSACSAFGTIVPPVQPQLSFASAARTRFLWKPRTIVTLLSAMDAFDEDGLRSICSDFLTRSAVSPVRFPYHVHLLFIIALFHDLHRSLSLKCFVSKFLLKVPRSSLPILTGLCS